MNHTYLAEWQVHVPNPGVAGEDAEEHWLDRTAPEGWHEWEHHGGHFAVCFDDTLFTNHHPEHPQLPAIIAGWLDTVKDNMAPYHVQNFRVQDGTTGEVIQW